MTSPESPAGARRRVRLALREGRKRLGYTQAAVADAMDWSHSKVIRIESGEVTISPNDLRPLLAHLGITHKATVDKLIQDARTSRRRQMWWDVAEVNANLTPASRALIQYELEAVEIRHFTNIMIPGPLQTTAYSEWILSGHHEELDEDAIRIRLETRGRRRRELLARRNFPKIFLLLEESVLKRRIHNAHTTGEQLLDLLRLSKEKPISLRVLPYTADAPLPVMGPFDLLTLTTGADEVMYRESQLIDELVEDPPSVERHHRMFETWWDAALGEAESAKLIAESADELIGSRSAKPPPSATETDATAETLSTAKAASGASRPRRPAS